MSWKNIPGWSCTRLRALYGDLAATLPMGARFVEVGVAYGASLAYFVEQLEARSGHPQSVELFAVDIWEEHQGGGQLSPEVWARVHAHGTPMQACLAELERECPIAARRATFLQTTGIAAADHFADASVDAIFLDEHHTRESVGGAIAAWMPKLKPGALLSGHDCNPHYPGVLEGVADHLAGFVVWPPHPDDGGWGGVWTWRKS